MAFPRSAFIFINTIYNPGLTPSSHVSGLVGYGRHGSGHQSLPAVPLARGAVVQFNAQSWQFSIDDPFAFGVVQRIGCHALTGLAPSQHPVIVIPVTDDQYGLVIVNVRNCCAS